MNTKQPKSWRDQIKVHPAAELFPMMPPDDKKALGEDIEQRGLWTNIAVWQAERGRPWFLVDGRNRLDAAELVGLSVEVIKKGGDVAVKVGNHKYAVDDLTSMDPYEWVISANIHRRHLTPEQKRDVIAKLLQVQPEKSDRQIGKQIKADHKTVGAVRAKLEDVGKLPHVEKHTDTKGRKQPTRKKAKTAATNADAPAPALQPTNTTTLKEQANAFTWELARFSDDYLVRVLEWHKAHPEKQCSQWLVGMLERVSLQMQMLAREISGRNSDDNDEAASVPAAAPVGDELDIPPYLRRT